ncbi:VWA domain-containing protein, partial [Desulfovibrio sp. MES5]|uniref:VWA domain-containing protein n=1 Tax=Desulfovibrio sp. MES5 TaxID=1899016 RepID=UPI0025C28371
AHTEGHGETWVGKDTVSVILKDASGNTFEASVKVNVVDDVPTVSGINLNAPNDADPTINGKLEGLSFGADVVGSKVEVTIDQAHFNGSGHYSSTTIVTGTVGVDGKIEWSRPGFTLDPKNGSFTYTRPTHDAQDGNKDTYAITVKVTDGDGDVVGTSATVCSTVINKEQVGKPGSDDLKGTEHNDLIIGDQDGGPITVQGHDYNIAFIVDTSGSMSGQIQAARNSLTAVFNELAKSVHEPNSGTVNILLVGFSTGITQNVSVNLNDAGALKKLLDAVDQMKADGGTNYELGLKTAGNWFASQDNDGENKTYFITDGKPTYYQYSSTVLIDRPGTKDDVTADKIDLSHYGPGQNYYENIDGKDRLLIDDRGAVYKWTKSVDWWGKVTWSQTKTDLSVTPNGKGGYELSVLAGPGSKTDTPTAIDSKDAFNLLHEQCSTIAGIGIGGGIGPNDLKDYCYPPNNFMTGISGKELADAIHGTQVDYVPSADTISGGDGADLLFGDVIKFEGIQYTDKAPVDALMAFVAEHAPSHDISKDELPDLIRTYHQEIADALDVTSSKGGNDVLYGGRGDDILFGQGGNDALYGGEGDDILHGGTGNDLLFGDGVNFDDGVNGVAHNSTLSALNALLNNFDADPVHIMAKLNAMTHNELSSFAEKIESTHGLEGSHGLESATDGNDWLYGGAGDDVLFGMGGNDHLYGGAGDDLLFGGSGNDHLYGGAGNDWLFGGSGNDYLDGGEGSDHLYGGSGNDIIVYDKSDILVDGGEDIDFLVGKGAIEALDPKSNHPAGLPTESTHPEVHSIEVFLDTELDLRSLDQVGQKLGITINNNKIEGLTSENGWSHGSDPDSNHDYSAYTHTTNGIEDATILVAKNILANNG